VATEVAARGLDIKELPVVLNFELPNVPEDYVHRIGRTARAGQEGEAVSLVSQDEAPLLKDIERLLRRSLPVAPLPDFEIPDVQEQPERRPARIGGHSHGQRGSGPGHRGGQQRQGGTRHRGGQRSHRGGGRAG
jgi:ATP-dependent RNA helicase RhlE